MLKEWGLQNSEIEGKKRPSNFPPNQNIFYFVTESERLPQIIKFSKNKALGPFSAQCWPTVKGGGSHTPEAPCCCHLLFIAPHCSVQIESLVVINLKYQVYLFSPQHLGGMGIALAAFIMDPEVCPITCRLRILIGSPGAWV